MGVLTALLTLLYIGVCVALIFFVLIQASKGSGLSGAFGSVGGSESLFGSSGSYTLVVKISVGLALAFLLLSVAFSFLPKYHSQGVVDEYASKYVSVEQAVESSGETEGQAAPQSDPGMQSSGNTANPEPAKP
ncbi:MAG TPA: preprotein translocase subunit SecG [bacterium]|nr:preprotein translocase subunit SecG [bacterium]